MHAVYLFACAHPHVCRVCRPRQLLCALHRHLDDFELHKELYRGKSSLLYLSTEKRSGLQVANRFGSVLPGFDLQPLFHSHHSPTPQVALKLYRKRKLSLLNRYQVEREIRIHIQLEHENVIRLYVAFEDEKNVYMVQEFAGWVMRAQQGGWYPRRGLRIRCMS